jgi:phosphoesterase RecJ-like protein
MGSIGGCCVSLSDLAAFDATYDDLDGVVEFIRNIDTIRISYLIKEVGPGEYRASLRSKPPVRVDGIARAFDGGGHAYAAGLSYVGSVETFQSKLLAACEEELCRDS